MYFRSVLLVVATNLLVNSVLAQDSTKVYELGDVVVQTNRIQLPISTSSRYVQVIGSKEIQAMPVQSVTEVLQHIGGLDVRQRGPHGAQADLSIRGGTYNQCLILVDGIRVFDPQTGHHSLNIPFSLDVVQRIEVLKGPAARVFGQNAYAGAINIITKKPNAGQSTSNISVGAGDFGLFDASLTHQHVGSSYNQLMQVSLDGSAGYRHNTDYLISNGYYNGLWEDGDRLWGVQAAYSDRAFGANGFYASPTATEQFEQVQTSLVSLSLKHSWRDWDIRTAASWRRNQDEYVFVRDNPSLYRNLHISQVSRLESHATYSSPYGKTGIGIEGGYTSIASGNLGRHHRWQGGLYAEQLFEMINGHLLITPGINVNFFSDLQAQFLPGIDMGILLNDDWGFFGNVGYTFRTPTYTELYYMDSFNEGNADLKPESAISYEGGVKWHKGQWFAQASYFGRQSKDLIDWVSVPSPSDLVWKADNIGQVNFQGVDAELKYAAAHLTPISPFGTLSYTYTDATFSDNDENLVSRYALDQLKHQVVFELGSSFWWFHPSVSVRYVDRATTFEDYPNDYVLVDAKLKAILMNKHELYFNITNIGSVSYTETNLVPMPGRWFSAGARIKLF